MKNCFIDIETGGFSATKNPLLQIGMIMDTDGKLDERSWFLQPYPADEIEDEALAVNGFTREQIKTFPQPWESMTELLIWLESHIDCTDEANRAFLIGYNVSFDVKFLKRLFERFDSNDAIGDGYALWFFEPPIDILTMARENVRAENHKMITVAKALGMTIDEESVHEAVCDVRIAREIYVAMCGENK